MVYLAEVASNNNPVVPVVFWDHFSEAAGVAIWQGFSVGRLKPEIPVTCLVHFSEVAAGHRLRQKKLIVNRQFSCARCATQPSLMDKLMRLNVM